MRRSVFPARGAARGLCGASPAGPWGSRGVLRRLGPSQRAPQCPWRQRLCRGHPPRPTGAAGMSLPPRPPVEPRDSDGEGESKLK